jgi:hypothetical protein
MSRGSAACWCTFTLGAMVSCGSEVFSTGAGGQGEAESEGGCGTTCIACCNRPDCPSNAPDPNVDCELTPSRYCSYVRADGCIHTLLCDAVDQKKWIPQYTPACPGACPNELQTNALCLEPGMICDYPAEGPGRCLRTTCDPNHEWLTPFEYEGSCD